MIGEVGLETEGGAPTDKAKQMVLVKIMERQLVLYWSDITLMSDLQFIAQPLTGKTVT